MNGILNIIKRYPISLCIIGVVIYLSFFKPPSVDIPTFPNLDKLVHFCMYAGVSGMLWIEFILNHKRYEHKLWHAWIGATLCPMIMGGVIEVLQENCTDYRGGDWLDFLANSVGVTTATIVAYFVIRPYIMRKYKNNKE